MASYGSYKKIIQGQIKDGTVPNSALEDGAGLALNVKYVYGQVNVCGSWLLLSLDSSYWYKKGYI